MGRAVSKDVPTSPNLRTHACVKTKLYKLYIITRLDFFTLIRTITRLTINRQKTFANFEVDMDFYF